MITIYIIEFFIFSFIGWILDSSYRSIVSHKFVNAGYFRGPFCPIYGFGGVVLVLIFKIPGLQLVWLLIFASLALILIEYLGSVISEKLLKVKLWDYSKSTFNIGGRVDLLHSIYWIILAVLFFYFIFPLVLTFETKLLIPSYLDIPCLVVFVVGLVWLTLRKNPKRYLDFSEKIINLTVAEYQTLYSDIKRLSKAKTLEIKNKIQVRIDQKLSNSGAKLKTKT
ncbi:MAG: putative ABC transporter permease [Candidatus ainarchaeum sp.]|nr:putative ABC transporter permease [Candidatus ainarchaeum sp.]